MLVLNEDCFEVTLMVGMLIRLPHGTLGDLYSPINQQVAVSTAAGCKLRQVSTSPCSN